MKTAQHLAELTGYSARSAERWLSGHSVLPADALAALIQSDKGREFLSAVMTDQTPRWWLQLKAFFRAVDLATAQRIQRRKLRELLDAEHAAGISHQYSAADLLQDEAFYQGQPSPAAHRLRSSVPSVKRK